MTEYNTLRFEFSFSNDLEVSQLADAVRRLADEMNAVVREIDTDVTNALTGAGTAYTPGTPGDWATSGAPDDVKEALDKIAAALGPI